MAKNEAEQVVQKIQEPRGARECKHVRFWRILQDAHPNTTISALWNYARGLVNELKLRGHFKDSFSADAQLVSIFGGGPPPEPETGMPVPYGQALFEYELLRQRQEWAEGRFGKRAGQPREPLPAAPVLSVDFADGFFLSMPDEAENFLITPAAFRLWANEEVTTSARRECLEKAWLGHMTKEAFAERLELQQRQLRQFNKFLRVANPPRRKTGQPEDETSQTLH